MFNPALNILNTGSIRPHFRVLKSYPIKAHTLIRPDYKKYQKEFHKHSFFEVTPTFETQVIEVPDLAREPNVGYLDTNNLQNHRDDLRLWLFWLMCQSRKKKETLSKKAKHLAELYIRISPRPKTIDDSDTMHPLPISSYATEYDPDDKPMQHYCYQIALISIESYWWHPKGTRCIWWAEEELLRMKHILPDITYVQHQFEYNVVATVQEKELFNKEVERALQPYLPKVWPLGSDPKAYPDNAPEDIPRYVITREEFSDFKRKQRK